MFDFLKKKINGFIDGLTKKEEQKGEAAPPKPPEKKPEERPAPEKKVEKKPEQVKKKAPPKEEPEPAPKKEPVPEVKPAQRAEKPPPKIEKAERVKEKPKKVEPSKKAEPKVEPPKPAKAETAPVKAEAPKKLEPPEPDAVKAEPPPKPVEVEPVEKPVGTPKPPPEKAEPEKPKERVKLGFIGKVKSIITREIEISETDVKDMLDNLELELLEADVDLGVAEGITENLSSRLIGSKVSKDKLHSFVSDSIRETLLQVLTSDKMFDIEGRLESGETPIKIMFIGINGAGKTTTIAKVANLLQKRGKKVVFAAADTFRAAAIEQMEVHAQRLGVKVIKREYGSDPTSVAYDAVNYAKAHGIDAVLIDTAGRQDTNISLLNEMKKMDRVIEPDLKIYIGESIAGNAIIEQVSSFDREVGVDGVILTKLDCDPKGGTMLSISRATGIPCT